MALNSCYINKKIYRSYGYYLKEISGVPYLLPYGQNVADHKLGVKINKAGAFIWEALENCHTDVSLQSYLLSYYEAETEEDKKQITEDMYLFLNSILAYKMIELFDEEPAGDKEFWYLVDETYAINQNFMPDAGIYSIAGSSFALVGPEGLFDDSLKDFMLPLPDITNPKDMPKPDVVVLAFPCDEASPKLPSDEYDDLIFLKNDELIIYIWNMYYRIFLPQSKNILEIVMPVDGRSATFYINGKIDEALVYDFFHALRLIYLYNAQRDGIFAMHSASILYEGKLWLFSGSSGTGKSTHTNMWASIYDTPVVNGDLNLLAMGDDGAVVYGSPWCGTSGIYSKEVYPLGGIILLEQAPTDYVQELSADQKVLLVSQRFISPTWFDENLDLNLAFAEKLTAKVPVCRLCCTPTAAAVEAVKAWIDNQL